MAGSDGGSRAGWRGCGQALRRRLNRKTLHKRVPVTAWLPQYSAERALGDLIAGVTVGLTVIPQSLAYSNIAGLPPQHGLYGSFLGCFVYIVLGGCRAVPAGPTAIASLLTWQVAGGVVEKAVLLNLLAGLVELLMGALGLGFLIDFVSGPVSSGFTSAVALMIATSQVKDLFAITVTGQTFLQQWISVFGNLHAAALWDPVLGFACIALLLSMRVSAGRSPPGRPPPPPRAPDRRSLSAAHRHGAAGRRRAEHAPARAEPLLLAAGHVPQRRGGGGVRRAGLLVRRAPRRRARPAHG